MRLATLWEPPEPVRRGKPERSDQSSGASGCEGARSVAAAAARRLEVALGHPVDERDEERNHSKAGDKERHEDERQFSQPFPESQHRG